MSVSHIANANDCKLKKTAYRNSDSVDTEITETKDTGTISHDANLRVLAGPVTQHGANRLALLDGDVQGFGAGVDARVLKADIADGGGIDEGHQFTDVVHEQTIKQVDVLVLDGGQVQILVDGSLTGVDHLHCAGALSLKTLHGVGKKASEVLGNTLLGSE